MRSKFLPLIVAASMTFGGAAFADTTTATTTTATTTTTTPATTDTTGTLTKIKATSLYVVLSDGWKYHLPKGFSLKGFKVGEKVMITWAYKGKYKDVVAMKAA